MLFAAHFLFTLFEVIFRKSIVLFPFFFVPRMGIFEALLYLPTAFLTDLGFVALILYLITRSKKDVKLPWFKFGVDSDEIASPPKPVRGIGAFAGLFATLAFTALLVYLYLKYGIVFFSSLNSGEIEPLFTPETGRNLSLIMIAGPAIAAIVQFAKLFTRSRWVNVGSHAASLVLIALILRQSFDNLFAVPINAKARPSIKFIFQFALLLIALKVTFDLVKSLVILGRRRLAAERAGHRLD